MLVFFIHGASVRTVEYADPLRNYLIREFVSRSLEMPQFYSSYIGEAIGDFHQLWDYVEQDLGNLAWDYPKFKPEDLFHYRDRRRQFIVEFFGDLCNYLNPQRGKEVRKVIALQLLNFIKSAPTETDLHIVAHSLGSAIWWDILFSHQFESGDPAYYIRDVIKGLSASSSMRKVVLRSMTTLGSPLLFFDRLLNIDPAQLHQFASRYTQHPLRWVNILHASDIFAYPVRASLELDGTSPLYIRDRYLGDRNFLKKSIGDVTMALGMMAEHTGYWRSDRVARLVAANLLGDRAEIESADPF